MSPTDEPASLEERRSVARDSSSSPIRIHFEDTGFEGRSDNLSEAGVFFFSSARLRVSVTIERGGKSERRHGTLVRVQRMSADTTGYAVEFDRS